ncbi:MAG: UvrD-helicase domain-containing protein [Mariprofundus sp.]|nr:UvrD-helicase domain-containing protein [Mariprofundus sp.]
MAEILPTGLNAAQQAAVVAGDGPQLILAGAGSGKTRTIVHRIGHLIADRGVAPHRILAVTFTNKSAAELKSRLSSLIGDGGGGVTSGTFHSISLRLLRRYAEAVGYPRSFQVIDSDDQKALIKRLLKQANIATDRLHPSYLLSWIEKCKHLGQTPQQAPADDWNGIKLHEFYSSYQQQLRDHERMDFSDLILNVVILMREHPSIAEALQHRFDHVLVDEYQDTNPVQHEWLMLLCAGHHNLTVVGDDDQSIYGWRGADIRHILDFEHIWSGAEQHRLEENYRSTASILALANMVIRKNEDRYDKSLRATQGVGEIPQWKVCNDEYDEARQISAQLRKWHDMGYEWQEMAILYRSNRQSLPLEQVLRETALPYRIIGGVGFFERLEIKDALAYWALLNRCGDGLQLMRICNRPKRGIGLKGQEQLAAQLAASGLRAPEWLDLLANEQAEGAAKKLVPLAKLIVSLREKISSLPDRGLMELLRSSAYLDGLQAMGELEAGGRTDNIQTLQRYIELTMEQNLTPVEFMDRAALLQSGEEEGKSRDNENSVTLMSLHRAKGLEFDCVVLPGVEDGLLPHQRSLDDGEVGIAEERRLLYVGITRARHQLKLTHARVRRLFGETHHPTPSRFLKDIPAHILQQDMPVKSVAVAQSSENGMGVGSSVMHPSFGEGMIIDFEGAGDAIRVSVQFRKVGIKRLMLKYAALVLL